MSPSTIRCWQWTVVVSVFLGVVQADVRRVPQEYATIQAALNAVEVDDTVLVSLGTYAEELQAPPVRFWLLGDVAIDTGDFARPTIDPSSLDSAQWRRCMNVPAGSQPTVERMGFVNRSPMYPRPEVFLVAGIEITSEDTVTFRYCRFDSVYRAISEHPFADTRVHFVVEDCRFLNAPRIQIRTSSDGTAEVRRCYFHGRRCTSELLLCGGNSDIAECVFTADSLYRAVNLYSNLQLAQLRNCLFGPIDTCTHDVLIVHSWSSTIVEGNVFHDIRTGGPNFGILWRYEGGPIVFRHNVLRDLATYGNGLSTGLSIEPYSEAPGGFSAQVDSNLFMNCTSSPNNYRGKALGIWTAIAATGNHFVALSPDSVASVNILFYPSPSSGSVLRFNQFEARDYGVGNSSAYEADAVWNYWGDATGPYNALNNPQGLGARVDDLVLFDPWSPDTNFLSVPGLGRPLPEQFVFEAYPNPFNSTVTLNLIPPEVMMVRVELFDVLGRKVKDIWSGPLAFQKQIVFDGSQLSSGIYFARVWQTIGNRPVALKKLMLLK